MRDAISLMEKALGYSKKLTVENVVKALGISDYTNLALLLEGIIFHDKKLSIEIIENVYKQGKDLKQFIKQFIQFILDICKYSIYENVDYIQIPRVINEEKGIDLDYLKEIVDYDKLLNILDKIIELQNQIKYEQNPKVLIESSLLLLCKGE